MVLLRQYACSRFILSRAILKLTSTQFTKGSYEGDMGTLRCPHCWEVVAGPREQAFEASNFSKAEQQSKQMGLSSQFDLLEVGM